ncbi:hypothetical protein MKY42_17210 [Paenibacillus sp. FSL W7-1088]|uniref:hypothetical protein n=1 Tax=Paenibacillus sp. FSL W7-1088 TaxID=2921695 RepID=UPI0030EECA49
MGEGEQNKEEDLLGCRFYATHGIHANNNCVSFNAPCLHYLVPVMRFYHSIMKFLNIYLFGTLGVLNSLGLDRLIAAQGFAKTAIHGICCCGCEHYPRHHFYLWYEVGHSDFIAQLPISLCINDLELIVLKARLMRGAKSFLLQKIDGRPNYLMA